MGWEGKETQGEDGEWDRELLVEVRKRKLAALALLKEQARELV